MEQKKILSGGPGSLASRPCMANNTDPTKLHLKFCENFDPSWGLWAQWVASCWKSFQMYQGTIEHKWAVRACNSSFTVSYPTFTSWGQMTFT